MSIKTSDGSALLKSISIFEQIYFHWQDLYGSKFLFYGRKNMFPEENLSVLPPPDRIISNGIDIRNSGIGLTEGVAQTGRQECSITRSASSP